MSIVLYLGNIGSGKSASAVRDMVLNPSRTNYYTNIVPKKKKLTPWIHEIKSDMIFKKKVLKIKKDGTPETKLEFNKKYWESVPRPLSFVWDEAHEIFDARNSMSTVNKIMGQMTAMARRICGEGRNDNDLAFITQLDRRIDVIAREMSHLVKYHVAHYNVECQKCKALWAENSEMPEKSKTCPCCGHYILKKKNFNIEVKHFAGIKPYEAWRDFGMNTYHARYFITDIEQYFGYYDTLQWQNLFANVYDD